MTRAMPFARLLAFAALLVGAGGSTLAAQGRGAETLIGGELRIDFPHVGSGTAKLRGSLDPGLELVGVLGQSGDRGLSGAGRVLEGGVLHRAKLPNPIPVFANGFEEDVR